jgi:hypothetical protein
MLLRFPRRDSSIPRERRDDVGQLRLRRMGHGTTLRDVPPRVRRNSRRWMTPTYRTCGRGTTRGSTPLAKTTLGRGLRPLGARPSVVLATREQAAGGVRMRRSLHTAEGPAPRGTGPSVSA